MARQDFHRIPRDREAWINRNMGRLSEDPDNQSYFANNSINRGPYNPVDDGTFGREMRYYAGGRIPEGYAVPFDSGDPNKYLKISKYLPIAGSMGANGLGIDALMNHPEEFVSIAGDGSRGIIANHDNMTRSIGSLIRQGVDGGLRYAADMAGQAAGMTIPGALIRMSGEGDFLIEEGEGEETVRRTRQQAPVSGMSSYMGRYQPSTNILARPGT